MTTIIPPGGFRTGHLPDHPEVVRRRAGLHLHPDVHLFEALAANLPFSTANRAFLSPTRGGPGILDQHDTGSCFPAGTPILMADGTERPIEAVGVGNEVRTHNGMRRRVTRTMQRPYEGPLYSLELHGYVYPTVMTEEHPVGVVRNGSQRPKHEYAPGEIEWVAAKDVRPGDFVLMPAARELEQQVLTLRVADYIEEPTIEVDGQVRCFSARRQSVIPATVTADARLAHLLGLFLAEGSYRKSTGTPSGVQFTFARHERVYQVAVLELLKEIFGVTAEVTDSEHRPSVTDVSVDHETLAKFFHGLCGEGALTKRLPVFLHRSPRDVKLAALRGWLEGDGTQNALPVYRRSVQLHGCTSSHALHRGLFQLALTCGLKPGCQRRVQESHQNAPAGSLYFYGEDVFTIFPDRRQAALDRGVEPNGKRKHHRECPLGFACRVKRVSVEEIDEPVDVFNLEVDGEHTYIANGMAVHNCEGHAHASGGTLRLAILGQSKGLISPSMMYLCALLIDRVVNPDGTLSVVTDTGTMPSSILTAWQIFGAILAANDPQYPASSQSLYAHPADENSPLLLPTPEKLYAASPYRFQGAYFITTPGPHRLLLALAALASGRPITDAIPASGSPFQGYSGGILGRLSGPIDHANLIVDYTWAGAPADWATFQAALRNGDTATMTRLAPGLVLHCVNSWGVAWGEDDAVAGVPAGMYRASTDYFDQAQDLCVVDLVAA